MKSWNDDKAWSDRFLPEIKRILGEHLIREATLDEDRNRMADLVVCSTGDVRVACRVRNHRYFAAYSNEFTIRSRRETDSETELAKIVAGGWVNLFFYGIADWENRNILVWRILDLCKFRLWLFREMNRLGGKLPGREFSNGDGTFFRVFDFDDLPPGSVLASSALPAHSCDPQSDR